MVSKARKMLENLDNLHELGRQRCFELDNPFYYKDAEDRNEPGNEKCIYYRKELNTGEIYLVTIEVTQNEDHSFNFKDTLIRQIR